MSDPLPQAMVLTAIVITLGMTAFLLAMAYRSWQLHRHDEVQDDVEDRRIARLAAVDERAVHRPDTEVAAETLDEEAAEARDETDEGAPAPVAGGAPVTDYTWLVPLPVVIPLSAAGLALALYRRPNVQRLVTRGRAQRSCSSPASTLLVLADDGPLVVDVGGWAAPVGIDLVADRLSALMLTISSAVTLCVLLYSLAQGSEDDEESAPVSIYHPTYLVLTAGVANAFLSGDLFNLYVGLRDPAGRQLRAHHARRHGRAHPRGDHLHRRRAAVARCCSSSRSR